MTWYGLASARDRPHSALPARPLKPGPCARDPRMIMTGRPTLADIPVQAAHHA